MREADARPLGDEGPAFLARLMRDLARHREAPDVGQRKRRRARDETIDHEFPLREVPREHPLIVERIRRRPVDRRDLRDPAAIELARERAVRGEQALRGIGQRLARAIEAAMVGWDQAVSIRETCGGGPSRCAGERAEPRRQQPAAREEPAQARPTIIAPTCLVKPDIATIATWPTTKTRSRVATTKWMGRADCWPPSVVTRTGMADVIAGDIARPVHTISGKRSEEHTSELQSPYVISY